MMDSEKINEKARVTNRSKIISSVSQYIDGRNRILSPSWYLLFANFKLWKQSFVFLLPTFSDVNLIYST